MTISKKELDEIASQLRCPDGADGIRVGEGMAEKNASMIHTAIDRLSWFRWRHRSGNWLCNRFTP